MRAVPARVFRPQGLVTLATAFSRRIRAGSVSHRQHPWVSPFGAFSSHRAAAAFPPRAEPACRLISRFTPPPKRQRRHARPRLPGSCPEQIPCSAARVSADRRAGCSRGLLPFQGSSALAKTRVSAAPHSHTLIAAPQTRRANASQSISTSTRSRPPQRRST